MPDKRDRDNEMDMVRDMVVAQEDIKDIQKRVETIEERFKEWDKLLLKSLLSFTRKIILLLGVAGLMGGNFKLLKDKIIAWLPW